MKLFLLLIILSSAACGDLPTSPSKQVDIQANGSAVSILD